MEKSIQEIINILEECKEYKLDMGAAASKSLEAIEQAYNGCGPESFPPQLRDNLNDLTREYRAAIMVHDCDFEESDGTDDKLLEATLRFRSNTAKILSSKYPFWTKKQFSRQYRIKRAKAIAMKATLDFAISPIFSAAAWKAAKAERGEKENGSSSF